MRCKVSFTCFSVFHKVIFAYIAIGGKREFQKTKQVPAARATTTGSANRLNRTVMEEHMKRFQVRIRLAGMPPFRYTAIARHVVDVVVSATKQFGLDAKITVEAV